MEYNGYQELANAIILQAFKDYRKTPLARVRGEVKSFFLSDWFRVLTNVSGQMIYERLEKERSEKENDNKQNKCRKSTASTPIRI